MSRYRRRPSGHKDSNHDAVVLELRQLGATVLETHALGDDAPDLVVGYQGQTALVELKSGDRLLSRAHVTQRRKRERLERQRAYLESWAGGLAFIAETTEQVLASFAAASGRAPLSAHGLTAPPVSSWSPLGLLLRPDPGAASRVTRAPAPPTPPPTRPASRRAVPTPAATPATPES